MTASANPSSPSSDVSMSLVEHLEELRKRLIRVLLGIVPGFVGAWIFREYLLEFLVQPFRQAWIRLGFGEPTLHLASPIDGFVGYMKMCFVVGLLASAPWTFWQIWAFIRPGLYGHEKRIAIPFVMASTVCFVGGAVFGYVVIFPLIFETLLGLAGSLPDATLRLQPTIMLTEFLGFSARMLLGFGVVFEVPVGVVTLSASGLVHWKQLLAFGRWWVVIASVLAMLLTPPDVGSMILMLVPLVLLYFVSIALAALFGKARP